MTVLVRPPRGTARPTAQKPKTQQAYTWPAPTRGLIANGNLATAVPGGAAILENYFCTATGITTRRGKERYATLGGAGLPVRSIFSYLSGNVRKLFACNDQFTYDITSVSSPYNWTLVDEDDDQIVSDEDDTIGTNSTDGLEAYANTSGKWITVQTQASDGSTYLVGYNGTDPSFIFDGTTFYPQVAGGLSTLAFDAEASAFTVGETVTGGTSGATAIIHKVISDGASGSLWLIDVTGGPFQDNEALTDGSGGAATADGVNALVPATGVTFDGDPPGLTTANLSFGWLYKSRLFAIEKQSLNAWYLPVGTIAGEMTKFSLGGQFKLGGTLVTGATWSRDTGSGLNAMCAFFSSEGEVAIYQGDNPGEAASWSIVGVYRIGRPLGPKSMMDAGGDLVIATDIGFVPLSRALDTDFAILGTAAVSEDIIDLWNSEVGLRSNEDWNVAFWSRKQMVTVALPTTNDQPARWFVANAKTKAWSIYSGWDATCTHVFGEVCYFGDSEGAVYLAETSGFDDGKPYTCVCLPMFDQMGVPGYKTVSMLRAVMRGPSQVSEKLEDRADYDTAISTAPSASPVASGSTWGDAEWGTSTWADPGTSKLIFQQWQAAYGGGEVHAPLLQITSGANVPLDAELIRVDGTFISGEIVV